MVSLSAYAWFVLHCFSYILHAVLIDIGHPHSCLSKSKDFDGIVPSIFDPMNHQYRSSWGHSEVVITNIHYI